MIDPALAPKLLKEGCLLGGCRIERLLGRGGMGEVYLAEHLALEKRVAVKVLPPARLDAAGIQRFLREARIGAQLEHPNVVTIYDVGQQDGLYYIVMQFIEGKNLSQLLEAQGGPLPWRTALTIIRQAGKGLAVVHRRGLMHRDIKPSNIMVSQARRVVLMDFGLVREETRSDVTETGAILGTPAYMAPEQCRGEEADRRADVYALGATLYSLLTAKLPFSGPAQSVLLQVGGGKVPPAVHEINPFVPRSASLLAAKMMAPAPNNRFADADAVVAEITSRLVEAEKAASIATDTHQLSRAVTLTPEGELALAPLSSIGDRPASRQTLSRLFGIGGGVLGLCLLAIALRFAFGEQAPDAGGAQTTAAPATQVGDVRGRERMAFIPTGAVMVGDSVARLRRHFSQVDDLQADPALMDEILMKWPSTEEQRVSVPGFWIDRYEVTNQEYAQFVQDTGHRPPAHWQAGRPPTGGDQLPVTFVDYEDASAYARWAGKQLPTERQWLRAFRGADDTLFPWGDKPEAARANVLDNGAFSGPSNVDATPRDVSQFDVCNLVGNVRELVRDRPLVEGAKAFLMKGVDWSTRGDLFGIASQRFYWIGSELADDQVGFRCVFEPAGSQAKP